MRRTANCSLRITKKWYQSIDYFHSLEIPAEEKEAEYGKS